MIMLQMLLQVSISVLDTLKEDVLGTDVLGTFTKVLYKSAWDREHLFTANNSI